MILWRSERNKVAFPHSHVQRGNKGKFTNTTHNLWNQKSTTGRAQLETTGAAGGTIFTRFKNQGSKWYISK